MMDRRTLLKGAILFIPAAGVLRSLLGRAEAKPKIEGYDPANHYYGMGVDSTAVLVGAAETSVAAPPLSLPRQSAEREGGRWCLPCFLGGHQ